VSSIPYMTFLLRGKIDPKKILFLQRSGGAVRHKTGELKEKKRDSKQKKAETGEQQVGG